MLCSSLQGDAPGSYLIKATTNSAPNNVLASKGVVIATSARDAYSLTNTDPSLLPPQRSVGCVYYGLAGEPPIKDAILVLNGEKEKGTEGKPINNLCFPSLVSPTYAPPGKHLCSVTVLGPTLDLFRLSSGEIDEARLDRAVKGHLSLWFPDAAVSSWENLQTFDVSDAQPAQFGCKYAASISGGRPPEEVAGGKMPENVVVAGDHQASATLNGAIEAGVKAAKYLLR